MHNIKDIERKIILSTYSRAIKLDAHKILDFYSEIAEIGLKAQNQSAMQIKLQWYMSAIDELYICQNTGNKTVDDLQPLIRNYNIPKHLFTLMLNARVVDFDQRPFSNLEDLLSYAQETSGAVWQMIAYVVARNPIEQDLKALEQVGKLFGIIGIIRNARFNKARDIYQLDWDQDDDTSAVEFANHTAEQLCAFCQQALNTKSEHLKSKKLNKMLLLNVFTKGYIKIIASSDYKVLENDFLKIQNKDLLKLIFLTLIT